MKCQISRCLLDRFGAAARHSNGEICGLLLGSAREIEAAVPLPNAAADPATAFLLEPVAHLRAARQARAAGSRIIGHYHSHPLGSVEPSAADAAAAQAEEGMYWLIITGSGERLWISRRNGSVGGAFDPIELEISEDAALQP